MTIEKDNGLRGRSAQVVKQIDGEESEADLTLLVSTDAMDDEGDVVEQEWEFPGQIPFLFVHDNKSLPCGHIMNPRVVGVGELPPSVRRDISDDATEATLVDVNADTDDPFAESVLRKYRRGDMEDSSVGFDPVDYERFGEDEAGRLHFLRSTLKEVSATPIGANSDTTVLRKEFDPDVLPEELQDGPAESKEGRRNSEMDEEAMGHAKEMLEFMMGDRDKGEITPCEVCKPGDHDDKSGGDMTVTVEAERVEEIVEEKVRELMAQEADEAGDQKAGDGQDEAGEPEGEPLTIDGEKTDFRIIDESEQPDSSSGEAGDGGTSEIDISAL